MQHQRRHAAEENAFGSRSPVRSDGDQVGLFAFDGFEQATGWRSLEKEGLRLWGDIVGGLQRRPALRHDLLGDCGGRLPRMNRERHVGDRRQNPDRYSCHRFVH